jgi:hypothetical protein
VNERIRQSLKNKIECHMILFCEDRNCMCVCVLRGKLEEKCVKGFIHILIYGADNPSVIQSLTVEEKFCLGFSICKM